MILFYHVINCIPSVRPKIIPHNTSFNFTSTSTIGLNLFHDNWSLHYRIMSCKFICDMQRRSNILRLWLIEHVNTSLINQTSTLLTDQCKIDSNSHSRKNCYYSSSNRLYPYTVIYIGCRYICALIKATSVIGTHVPLAIFGSTWQRNTRNTSTL